MLALHQHSFKFLSRGLYIDLSKDEYELDQHKKYRYSIEIFI